MLGNDMAVNLDPAVDFRSDRKVLVAMVLLETKGIRIKKVRRLVTQDDKGKSFPLALINR